MPNPAGRLAEATAPSRLGRSFRWLLATSVLTNIGDGVALAAGPLLVASETRDPLLVSMALLAQNVPVLLFGFAAGVVADRVDRIRIIVVVNLARALVLALLAATIVTGDGEHRRSSSSRCSCSGPRRRSPTSAAGACCRGSSGARTWASRTRASRAASCSTNQLIAPPIGAALFVVGMALPFAADAACFALGALLITRVRYSTVPEPPPEGVARTTWRADMAEGIRWLADHPPMRTLFITIVAFNVTFGAAWAVLVLYAQERLG